VLNVSESITQGAGIRELLSLLVLEEESMRPVGVSTGWVSSLSSFRCFGLALLIGCQKGIQAIKNLLLIP